jgi:hypothetical protein
VTRSRASNCSRLGTVSEYGLDDPGLRRRYSRALRRAMRAALPAPHGTYTHAFKPTGSMSPSPRIAITVKGDRSYRLCRHWPQVDRAISCTLTYTFAIGYAPNVALPAFPTTKGFSRPLRWRREVPLSTALSRRRRRAHGDRSLSSHRRV